MRIVSEQRSRCLVLTIEGRLDSLTAPALYRTLLVALAEYQQGMVCDVGGLRVADPQALTLFRGVGMQAMHWPGTPLILCRPDSVTTRWLHRLEIDRVVSVRATLAAAMSMPRYQEPVAGEVLRLPPDPGAATLAGEFVRGGCREYAPDTVESAVRAVRELVEYAAAEARIELCVLLARRGPAIRIAVIDDNPSLPSPGRETGADLPRRWPRWRTPARRRGGPGVAGGRGAQRMWGQGMSSAYVLRVPPTDADWQATVPAWVGDADDLLERTSEHLADLSDPRPVRDERGPEDSYAPPLSPVSPSTAGAPVPGSEGALPPESDEALGLEPPTPHPLCGPRTAVGHVLNLQLLDSLVDRWGALPSGSGKLLWCLIQE